MKGEHHGEVREESVFFRFKGDPIFVVCGLVG